MQQTPSILHREDGWVAVSKPSGWLVHRGTGDAPDLVSWMNETEDGGAWAPVHRLDGETSGVVLLAQPSQRAKLSAWFAEGEIRKVYLALVHGRTRRKGIIRRKLSDARRGRPLPAVTRYRTLRWLGAVSLVSVRPETGRKHQIRRHMAHIGHPLVGDRRHGRMRSSRARDGARLWLHASSLTLPSGHVLSCPLPDDFEAHLASITPPPDTAQGSTEA